MGYYTDFEVSVDDYAIGNDLDKTLKEVTKYSFRNGYLQEAKWYDWKRDMLTISNAYPEAIFTVEGNGEEAGDMWRAYFKNGKVQVAKAVITYAPFNPELLS